MTLKRIAIFAVLFTLGFSIAPSLRTQAFSGACISDYYSFILTVRSAATRKQTFSDFFSLGYCQLNDIIELEDELDSVRDALRTASESCEDTADYKNSYDEILMEEYFVRNIQKSRSDVINAVDEEKLKSLKEAKLEKLKQEMELLFVDQEARVSQDTFDQYFSDWSSKYDDRIANYAHCEEGAWAELQTTWTDFVDDINKLNIDVEKQDFSFTFKPDVEVDKNLDEVDMSGMGKTTQNAYDYFNAKKEQREAEVEAAATVQDLSNSGQAMSYQEALEALQSDDQSFSIQTNAADRMSNYEILYGAGGAVAATDLQSVLVYLNQTLQATNTEDFPNITSSAEQVYDKQCR